MAVLLSSGEEKGYSYAHLKGEICSQIDNKDSDKDKDNKGKNTKTKRQKDKTGKKKTKKK